MNAVDRSQLHALLGHQIGRLSVGRMDLLGARDCAGVTVQDLRLVLSDGTEVPAWHLPARGAGRAVLYCHAHGNRYETGRDELLEGRPALQGPYLGDLAALGCAVLCIELPCFGQRADPPESALAKAGLWRGTPLFGRMLAELAAALGWLAAAPGVEAGRIGVMGLSMGGTLACWLAALDPRLKATAALCCFADLEMLVEGGAHDGHGLYMVVPGLLPVARTGRIAGLIAPRALFIGAGMQDWSTPAPAFDRAMADLAAAYEAAGAEPPECHVEAALGHAESPAMRRAVLSFLDRAL